MPARRNPARPKAPSPARPRPATTARRSARPRDEGIDLARRLGLADVPPWAGYVHRGRRECAFSQLKLLGRIVGTIYDQALEPVGLRASQPALMGDRRDGAGRLTTLGATIHTDQTTLSRTVQTLRRMRLVSVKPGPRSPGEAPRALRDRQGALRRAMPHWERATRSWRIMPLDVISALGKKVHRAVAQAS
jgi:hypothetical protein